MMLLSASLLYRVWVKELPECSPHSCTLLLILFFPPSPSPPPLPSPLSPSDKYSGCVVNTCGWVDGLGYKILEYACLAFDASLVLVIDNERLLYDLKRNLPEGVDVLHLPKSGGVSRQRVA